MTTTGNASQEGYNIVGEVVENESSRSTEIIKNVPDVLIEFNNFYPVIVDVSSIYIKNVFVCQG